MMRTTNVEKLPIRLELERGVVAHNKYLIHEVKRMSIIILLRHTHPLYRANFARRLYEERLITSNERSMFVKKGIWGDDAEIYSN